MASGMRHGGSRTPVNRRGLIVAAITTVPGQVAQLRVSRRPTLITRASDKSGNIYRHVVHITPGPNVFTAPVPLSQINDIGGILYTTSTSYGCCVAPYRSSHRLALLRLPSRSHRRPPRVTRSATKEPVTNLVSSAATLITALQGSPGTARRSCAKTMTDGGGNRPEI
jgi:hypothetical protein